VTSHPLGPNGRFVDRFLAQVAVLQAADVDGAVLAWRESQRAPDGTPLDSAPPAPPAARADWAAAEEAAAAALVRTRRGDAAWALQDRVHAVVRHAPWRRRAGAPFAGVRSAATAEYLVATAAVALVVADALPPRHLARLYAPFLALVPLTELADLALRASRSG
jgi:hypothetical protein